MSIITNVYLWIGLTFLFMLLFFITFVFLFILGKKTHMIVEFKAWLKGQPICLFFQDNRYCEWKPIKPEAGIITHKDFGAFIINPQGTYIDQRTKSVLIPFDSAVGVSLNVHACKLAEELRYVTRNDEELGKLRRAIVNNDIEDSEVIEVLKTSVNFGSMKTMLNALLPHNIESKIEKTIAARLKGFGKVNPMQAVLIFCAIFGAMIIGYMVLRLAVPK